MSDTHAAEQQETVVVIETEAPEVNKTDGDKGAAVTQQTTGTDDAVADLKAQVEEQRKGREAADAARLAAEQRAQAQARAAEQARKEAESARTEATETQASSIEAGLQAAQSEASAGETEYKTAMEAGDWPGAAKAQRKMAAAEARIVRLSEAKDDLAARKTEATIERTEQRTEAPSGDPVENFLATRTDATRNWLREHPDHARALAVPGSNARLAAKLNAADSDAVAEGLDRDSDAYFMHVEKFLGLNKGTETQQQNNGAQQQNGQRKRTGSPPVASVQASGGGTGGNSGTEVRLSPGEARAAVDGTHTWNYDDPSGQKRFKKGDPIGTQEFARRKLAMQQQGLYDKVFVEQ